MRELIEEYKASKQKCRFCDNRAVKSQKGKPVCAGHAKGGSGCK